MASIPPKPENPLHLHTTKLTLGCPILDSFLGGGIPCGSITELVGESSAGKTQLCLQLLLSSLLPPSLGGLSSPSLYIYSEPPFPLRRLLRLSLPSLPPCPLDHVFVRLSTHPDDLLSLLSHLPDSLPVRLIVIDSIAALFRSEFDNTPRDLKSRSSLFFKISTKLKDRARKLGAAVVVTNHVVDVVEAECGGARCLWSSGRRVVPALGLAWSHCVNTRVFLTRSEGMSRSSNGEECEVRTRRMHVVFSPCLPERSCEFAIVGHGVLGVG
ncbi:LOW QUALITY PROTEIN: DNA repair protein XRCC3 homolog [Dioscorea cayenensis subsp. rotundata]|uniref:LOW QUALITY PROTEIN: DNA repair protein XRCC3 homolog n=1 Tax=Dioscorea cayennensis subsp. rotundata TaxID=55577 RepID=A0AB40AYW5_DIOCR|nr:LOW QUALITY PROTEIN: DNA repair protein XRCC3 homolog [Dioscorea cayenensis subsp. rotundata]